MAESIELQIESDARGAIKSIGNLETKLSSLGKTLSSINTSNLHSFSSGLKELSVSMGSLSKIDTRTFTKVAKNIKKFEEIDSGKISQLSSTLAPLTQGLSAFSSTSFDNKSLTNFINSFTRLANSNISGLSNVNFTDLGNRINGLASALSNSANVEKNTIQVVNAVSNLAKAGDKAQATATSLPLLGSNLRSLISSLSTASIVSDNTIQFASALGVLASAGNRTAQTASNLGLLATELKKFMQVMATAPTVNANIIQMTNALANLANAGSRAGSASKNLISGFTGISKHTGSVSKGFGGLASAIGRFYAKWFIVIRAIRKLGDFVNLSSQLTEVQNVVDTTFGNMANKVDDFTKTSIQDFGMSELTAKQIASRFQALGTAVNISSQQIAQGTKLTNDMFANQKDTLYESTESLADMSLNLTKLSADMASFYDVDQTDVAKSLQSIFTGTIAPMRQYGLDLTQATLKEFALKNGLDADIKSMTQAEKVMLRYQYVMANTTAAQGDFAKTADTWANSVRTLKQEFEAWGSIIGKVIINAFKPFVIALRKAMVYVIQFTQTVADALGAIFGWTIEVSGGGIADGMEDIADSTGDIGTSADKANSSAKKLKNTLLSIDEIHALNDNTDSSSSGGSGSGAGAGGGSGVSTSLKPVDGLPEKYKSAIKDLYQLGSYIGDAITNSLNSIDWDKVYQGAKNFGTGLADFLNGLISPELFGALGKTIAGSVRTVIVEAFAFSNTFDWGNLGDSFASFINGAFHEMSRVSDVTGLSGWQELGQTINNFVHGIRDALINAISEIDWNDALKGIAELVGELDIDTFAIIIGAFTWKYIGKKLTQTLLSNVWETFVATSGLSSMELALSGIELVVGIGTIYFVLTHAKGWVDALKEWAKSPDSAIFNKRDGVNYDGEKVTYSTTLDWKIKEIKWKIEDFKDSIDDFFEKVGKAIQEAWEKIRITIYNSFVDSYNDIVDLLNKLPNVDIPEAKKKTLSEAEDTAKGVDKSTTDIKNSYVNMGAGVSGALSDLNNSLRNTSEKTSDFQTTTQNIVQNISGNYNELKDNTSLSLLGVDTSIGNTQSKMNELSGTADSNSLSTKLSFANLYSGVSKSLFDTNTSISGTKGKIGELGTSTQTTTNSSIASFTEFAKSASQNLASTGNSFSGLKNNVDVTNNSLGTFKWFTDKNYSIGISSWGFDGVKNSIDNIVRSLGDLFKYNNQKFNITTGTQSMGYQSLLDLAPKYATGGFPEDGLFYANHGEMVGKFANGKTAVANNDQITDGIRQAVVEGMMEVFMATNSNNSPSENSAPIIENIVKVDSETLYRITQQGKAVHDQRFNVITEIG